MISLVAGDAPDLLERLARVRHSGNAPLVTDPRWPRAQLDAVADAARRASVPDDVGWAALTSGSSGQPRIVLRSAASWAASFPAVEQLLGTHEDDRILLPAPASSSLTLFSLAHALGGGPRPCVPGSTADPDAVCLHATPQGLRTVLDRGPAATPRLRTALVGGSALDASLRQKAESRGIRVVSYYGAAELSFVAIDDGTGWQPFPGVEIDIVDDELWVRSPFLSAGYADGGSPGPLRWNGAWATVGDRARWVNGCLDLLGRADEAILSASATIRPDEAEAVLRSVPGVRDAVVFGVPRGRVGSLVAALLEPDPPGWDRPVLRATVRGQLAPAHRPRRWFAGALPRTASGKPARAEARRRALAGELARYA
ncbi:class I adenylate-forming enzyme family protein [uncultured Microbacterium sp.]|uniref:class I adenylate-forming enzyme family protein n=1 Tax=uncultured Microbacterium sp. TaxID=191216 RepID=UPI0028DBFD63|nr:class I adenylate-forming enzyme family protein [uncultured Microbacterium sp.]